MPKEEEQQSIFIKAVRCSQCKRIHAAQDTTFFFVKGSIYIGMGGGVVGTGAPDSIAVWCTGCLIAYLQNIAKDAK